MIEYLPQAGSPDDLLGELKVKLSEFQALVGSKMVVTSGYRPQSDGSQHQLRKAADVMFPDAAQTLLDLYHLAEQVGFMGIGIYPAWRLNGVKLGGLHVDIRDKQGEHAKWMGVPAGGWRQQYIVLNDENLKKWGIV